jgi:hypothetical protein
LQVDLEAAKRVNGIAFDACHFQFDRLKIRAPFWRLEEKDNGAEWVDARESDKDTAQKWGGASEVVPFPHPTCRSETISYRLRKTYPGTMQPTELAS